MVPPSLRRHPDSPTGLDLQLAHLLERSYPEPVDIYAELPARRGDVRESLHRWRAKGVPISRVGGLGYRLGK